jgi:hypothetical protein
MERSAHYKLRLNFRAAIAGAFPKQGWSAVRADGCLVFLGTLAGKHTAGLDARSPLNKDGR